jgi:nucleoside-diphosphate-sugar epimerase
MSQRTTILMTGATGVVGSAVLAELRHHDVVCLVHRGLPRDATDMVSGDLTAPGLGLDPITRQRLADRVDMVVHAAGEVSFSANSDAAHRLNARGAEEITRFCADADVPLVYLSTAFVRRQLAERRVLADDLASSDDYASPYDYLASKRAGDEIVRRSGIPYATVRPSVVIGDSMTGVITRFQGLHAFATALLRNQMPFLPTHPHVPVDVVPQDYLAVAIRAIVDHGLDHGLDGTDYWLTAGDRSPSVTRLVELIAEAGAARGVDIQPPRFVAPDTVDRLVRPAFFSLFPSASRRRMEELIGLVELFAGHETFPSSWDSLPGGPRALDAATVEQALAASFTYLVRTKGLGSVLPAVLA